MAADRVPLDRADAVRAVRAALLLAQCMTEELRADAAYWLDALPRRSGASVSAYWADYRQAVRRLGRDGLVALLREAERVLTRAGFEPPRYLLRKDGSA